MEVWRHGGMEAWRHGGMEARRHLQQASTKVSLPSYGPRAVSAISIVTPDPCHCVCVRARVRARACVRVRGRCDRLATAGEKHGAVRTLVVEDMLGGR